MVLELWFYILMLTGLPCCVGVLSFFATRTKIRRTDIPRCDKCDYDLSSIDLGDLCPECGSFARTRATGTRLTPQRQRTIHGLCITTPPLATAILYAVLRPGNIPIAAAALAGLAAAVPISLAAARLIDRATTAELLVLTSCATAALLAFLALFLHNLGSPFDTVIAFTCAPILALGPGGWGAGLGALAIWIRDEYVGRR